MTDSPAPAPETPRIFALTRRLTPWAAYLLAGSAPLVLMRWRLLSLTPGVEQTALNLLWAVASDVGTLGTLGLALFLLLPEVPAIFGGALAVIYTLLGVIFQIKTGHHLTTALLSQLGGIFEIRSSIQTLGNFRTYLQFSGLILAFASANLGFRHLAARREALLILPAAALFSAALVGSVTAPPPLEALAYTPLLELVKRHISPAGILEAEIFKGLSPRPLETVHVPARPGPRRNLIFLQLESFSYQLAGDDEKLKRVMPFLYSMRKHARQFLRHYTAWPLSSKSLHSVVCGSYPYPTYLITMRVAPDADCASWARALAAEGYRTWAGYSGDLHYDRMGTFLRAQGFQVLRDLFDFRKAGSYREMSWGVDDRAIYEDFDRWLEREHPDHFAGLFITTNSHHPYWTPDPAFTGMGDGYVDSFHYQDELLRRLFESLEKRELLDRTVIVITGDHGVSTRDAQIPGTLNEHRYHVPLWIFEPDANGKPRTGVVDYPTSHVDLKGAIYKATGNPGTYLLHHDLEGGKPAYVLDSLEKPLFMLIDRDQSWLLDPQDNRVFLGGDWVRDHGHACPKDGCREQKQRLLDLVSHSLNAFPQLK